MIALSPKLILRLAVLACGLAALAVGLSLVTAMITWAREHNTTTEAPFALVSTQSALIALQGGQSGDLSAPQSVWGTTLDQAAGSTGQRAGAALNFTRPLQAGPQGGVIIPDVPAGRQERLLNCEFRSAADLAAFYGLAISWEEVFFAVGHDPNGDPNVGFVGDSFDDPPGGLFPDGYGVYAPPLAGGLKKLGLKAVAVQDKDRAWLMEQIAHSRPVIVWASYGMRPQTVTGWYTRDGKTEVKAIREEHTYTVIGYSDSGVYLNDPFDGQRYHYTWADFLRSWGYLDNMALVVEGTADVTEGPTDTTR